MKPNDRNLGWRLFGQGVLVTFNVVGAVLFASSIGYGASARDAGLSLGQTVSMVAIFNALPAQVVFVDQIGRGAGLLTAALLVSLTAMRFVPTTASITPLLRSPGRPAWRLFASVHFMSLTAWVEGSRRLPDLPVRHRLGHFIGIGVGALLFTMLGAAVGFMATASVPPVLKVALLILMPVYFGLSLIEAAKARDDYAALILGGACGPVFYLLTPEFDLLMTGLVAGTAAYLIGRARR